jgi:diadenosine tetraphosphate (Ap4A) HIT family hydrolase
MGKLLFRLIQTRWGGWLVRGVFAYMRFAIPVDRLHETATLLAFHRPRPAYPVHILIVPQKNPAQSARFERR